MGAHIVDMFFLFSSVFQGGTPVGYTDATFVPCVSQIPEDFEVVDTLTQQDFEEPSTSGKSRFDPGKDTHMLGNFHQKMGGLKMEFRR